jgi:ATP-dependent exoDNAse (exonuclease V) beta subunit
MTIHAAKGLEFPAVALPALSGSGTYNKSKLLFHQQFGIVLNTSRTDQERDEGIPLPYQIGRTLDDDMDLAEKKRLFYVAMTRARDYLALFIDKNEISDKSAAGWLNPLLERLGKTDVLNRTDMSHSASSLSSREKDLNLNERESSVQQEENFADINAAERLLEPLAISIGTQVPTLPETSLFHRITPSARHCEPSPVLVGKFFHRIMEYLPQGRISLEENELQALLEQFADEAVHPAFKKALIEEGKKLISLYSNSKFHELFSEAKTICHEWSYYIQAEDQLLTLNRPDLLLETKDGAWYIIDYKTDRFAPSDIQQQAMRHRPQLQRYSSDFNSLTNIKPRLAVYFAQIGTLHEYA